MPMSFLSVHSLLSGCHVQVVADEPAVSAALFHRCSASCCLSGGAGFRLRMD